MSKKQMQLVYRTKFVDKSSTYKRAATWKIAYADFITAMMAFFMLLWILSITPQNKLKGIAEYFAIHEPTGNKAGFNSDDDKLSDDRVYNSIYGSNTDDNLNSENEKQQFNNLINKIKVSEDLKEYLDNIEMEITGDGLKIQITDSDNRPVFKPNTYELQPYMHKVLIAIIKMIKYQPNYIALSGHTASIKSMENNSDIKNENSENNNWFLSIMRANEIRKFLSSNNIKSEQILWVTGKADREPIDYKDKYNNKNIRISITLLNNATISRFHKALPDKAPNKQKNNK